MRNIGVRAIPNRGRDPIWRRLKTRAEDMGDHYLVNGQKIWTSNAHEADWIFCLVRTDPSAKRRKASVFC